MNICWPLIKYSFYEVPWTDPALSFRICRVVMHLFTLGISMFQLIWWDYEMAIVRGWEWLCCLARLAGLTSEQHCGWVGLACRAHFLFYNKILQPVLNYAIFWLSSIFGNLQPKLQCQDTQYGQSSDAEWSTNVSKFPNCWLVLQLYHLLGVRKIYHDHQSYDQFIKWNIYALQAFLYLNRSNILSSIVVLNMVKYQYLEFITLF